MIDKSIVCGVLGFGIVILGLSRGTVRSDDNLEAAVRLKAVELEAERRHRAEYELAELRRKREGLENRIEYARRTVLQSFNVYDRGVIPHPESVPKRLQKTKRQREVMVYRLLEFRRDSANLIASGQGLNCLLEICGPTAFADAFYRSSQKDKKQRDKAEEDAFCGITDSYRLTAAVLGQVRYQRGLAGPRLSGRLNQDPLDTNWPAILRTSTFQRQTEDIEKRRNRALRELRSGKAVSPKTADELLDAVQELLAAVEREQKEVMKTNRNDPSNRRAQADWFRLHASTENIRILLAGAYRLIEAKGIDDVALPPLDTKEGVTIEKLIAYMHENNLFFSPADANGQGAYNMVFELLTRYYIDLSTLQSQEQKLEKDVQSLKAQEREMTDVMLGNKLDNLQQKEIAVAQYKAVAAMFGTALMEAQQRSRQIGGN